MNQFFSPPQSDSQNPRAPLGERSAAQSKGDPALTAQTFTQNPTLSAALARLRAKPELYRAVNTGAETPDITFAYRYQVHTVTAAGTPAEIITVVADDMCDAIQKAIAQLVAQHADGVRVVACREKTPRGVA